MRTHSWLLLAVLWFGCPSSSIACLWDSDTLADEKKARPALAEAILGKAPDLGDPGKLRKRIAELESNRRENDPVWWNDLAGALIRLGESQKAATLLESVRDRFPNDYGVHANLGTAYHLLGRYAEAEKHIARDLEINPNAHFGLEKYHLALLQYLNRDEKYKSRHVYVDEFTIPFIRYHAPMLSYPPAEGKVAPLTNDLSSLRADLEKEQAELLEASSPDSLFVLMEMMAKLVELDPFPAYREIWNLAGDTNLQSGVIYMAGLNPREPACFVMLGVLATKHRDLNLAAAAFEKAIALGTPQKAILESKVASIRKHIREAKSHDNEIWKVVAIVCVVATLAVFILRAIVRFVRS